MTSEASPPTCLSIDVMMGSLRDQLLSLDQKCIISEASVPDGRIVHKLSAASAA